MTYDGHIDIATGLGANSRIWKNSNWQWSALVRKLKSENKTNETYKEYESATKTERSKIKDVGGYVGGYLRAGRRKPENVVHRQLLTLDIDFAHLAFWDDFCMQFDNAAVLHGTHTHSEDNPRYRLILPLSREASPDEYVAVGRKLAGELGIELFDNTTFETNRLMFWPSNPKDVNYYCETQDGPWLNVDQVLVSYVDWKDSSLWPTAEKKIKEVQGLAEKQEDPEVKRGMVGAFCRTFTITEAIDAFLSESYVLATEGRYTYLKGTAAAGLVIYDDKFAYSHHGTDPSSGKLCNAFDLVRLHLYGHLDTNESKTKSMNAMNHFVRENNRVKKTIAEETINDAKYDFVVEETAEELDLTWAEALVIDNKGGYISSASNLNLIFANDQKIKGLFRQNDFDGKRYLFGTTPWRKITEPEVFKNVDYSGIRNYIETVYGIIGSLKVDDSLALEFEKRSFHPVRDYLTGLIWDGTQRVDTFLIDYFGADNDSYTREAIRKTLVGAVARVIHPGVKFDLVLTLVGYQGTGKSTMVTKLGKGWSSDTFTTVQGKEAFEQLQGAWLIEMAELDGLRKAEVESIKHFISKQEDTFRPAYARTSETYKRQCVFIGTTNNKDFLRDPSGNRRFMPVDIAPAKATKSIFDIAPEEIDQVWAEAVECYEKGENLFLSINAEELARAEQRKHSETDERKGIINKYLDTLLPSNWETLEIEERRMYLDDPKNEGAEREHVCVAEVWCECLGKEKEDMDRYKTRDINDILRSLENFEQSRSSKSFKIYGTQRFYSRTLY